MNTETFEYVEVSTDLHDQVGLMELLQYPDGERIKELILKFRGDPNKSVCPGTKKQAEGIDDLTEEEYHNLATFVTMALGEDVGDWYFDSLSEEEYLIKKWKRMGKPIAKFKMRAEYFRDIITFFDTAFTLNKMIFGGMADKEFLYLPWTRIESNEYGASCSFYTTWSWEMLYTFIVLKIDDGHVMAETVAPFAEYTGEREEYAKKRYGTTTLIPTAIGKFLTTETWEEVFPEHNRTETTTKTENV
jgi:hypothetical protein